jgi:hypothetical protein
MSKSTLSLGLLLLLSACHPHDVRSAPATATAPVRGGCRSATGCGPTRALPKCTAAVIAAVAELPVVVAGAGGLQGKQVTVRGPLRRLNSICTMMFCANSCCNRCGASLALADAAALAETDAVRRDAMILGIGGPQLSCSGDESLVCCDVETTGQTVVAQGTLQRNGSGWMLADSQLCTL